MYKCELKYMNIFYTDKDKKYIDLIINKIDTVSEEIVNFFELENFGDKVNVYLYDDLDKFREFLKQINNVDENGNVIPWICGVSSGGKIIRTLCLDEYKKTKSHENDNLEDLIYLILHEFVHACHYKYFESYVSYKWIREGLATTISHQYDNKELKITSSSLEEMEKGSNYNNFHTMVKYVLDTYGKEYLLKLAKNDDLLKQDSSKLFSEVFDLFYVKKR